MSLMDRSARLKLYVAAVLTCFIAPAEIAGIGSVVAFLGVLASPEKALQSEYLRSVYEFGGYEDTVSFVTALGIAMVLAVTLSNALQATVNHLILRLTWQQQIRLSMRLLRNYLNRDYLWFLSNNTSELGKSLLTEVGEITGSVLSPVLGLASHLVRVLGIASFLFLVDPKIFVVASVTVGLAFSALVLTTRVKLKTLGATRLHRGRSMFKVAGEMLSGIKEVKLFDVSGPLLRRFENSAEAYAKTEISRGAINIFPRYALQTLALTGISCLAIYLLNSGESDSKTFSTLAVFALGGYRLMGACQRVFASYSSIKFGAATIDSVKTKIIESVEGTDEVLPVPCLQTAVTLDKVSFAYPGQKDPILENIELRIPRGQKIAFVGTTGAGKTTLLNLLLGLLRPTQGQIHVDDTPLTKESSRGWQRQIGYVPQDIFLLDDTVLRNIAFALPDELIDHERAQAAASVAQLHDFITEELENGYKTVIGERGVRLSGGQRQRLGLARALYRNPAVLVLDEATSALDSATEAAVINDLEGSTSTKTVVVVAHRFQTVRRCDTIHVLKNGRLVSSGPYDELMETCEEFRRLAGEEEFDSSESSEVAPLPTQRTL